MSLKGFRENIIHVAKEKPFLVDIMLISKAMAMLELWVSEVHRDS